MTTQRSNSGTLLGGILLVGLGILALFGQVFHDFHLWGYAWPLFIIGCGAMFFAGMFLGGKSLAGLAIPGSIIAVNGLMLFYQNLSGHWTSWSYGWTITLASVGLGIFIMGAYQGNESNRQVGLKVMKIAAVLFVIFGAFFEMLFSPFGLATGRYTFPVLLIVLGGYLVVSRSGLLNGRKPEPEAGPEIAA
jgi:hypothetical protein